MASKEVTLNPGESKVVTFEAIPSEARIYQVLVNGLTGSFVAVAPFYWLLPTGHIDPENDWDNEPGAYDGIIDTYAENWTGIEKWSGFIELIIPPTDISGVRCYITSPLTPKIGDIDVFYDGAWHDVYEGTLAPGWNEKDIPDGVKVVTKARFRMYNRSYTRKMRFRLHEFQFWGA
ncbi:unnamed protein product [marine sediment metagenome]|uniref:Uncharacterized protein n=1 Tax=marine sediment metagenome TaxID=412755 RepID=X1HGX8_9ZZZZ